MRSIPIRRSRRALFAVLLVALTCTSVFALATGAGAVPPQGPAPAANATITVSPVDGLTAGTNVNYTVNTSGGTALFGITVHLCKTGFTPASYNSGNFGFVGAQGTRCVNSPGIVSGTGLSGAGISYEESDAFGGNPAIDNTSGVQSIKVGAGTVDWANDSGFPGAATSPHLTCNATNPCDLVFKVDLTGSPATTYFVQQLNYAALPTAPTALAAVGGNTQASLSWTAPPGSVTNYQVNVSPAPASGPCSSGTCLTGSAATNFVVPGLTNFTPYTFTVQAINGVGTGPVSNVANATPGPAGPTLSGTSDSGAVDLSWSSVAGATNYRITVSPAPSTTPGGPGNCDSGTCLSGGATSFTVDGLANGTTYTFTVAAQIGANFTAESNAVAVAPNANLVTQTINVTRPEGVLVISQYCSGLPVDIQGNFDPSNNNGNVTPNVVPATNCNLTLSGPRTSDIFTDAITPDPRGVLDAVTNGTTTITSATIAFTSNDVNQLVRGDGIAPGTRIASVTNAQTAVLSTPTSLSFDGGQFHIIGSTVSFASAHTFTVGNEIEGLQIPGGSTITNVVSTTAVDISQPAEDAATGMTVRIWKQNPTPAHLITSGPLAGQYLQADGQMRQVMVVDTRPADPGWTATGQVTDFCVPTTTTCFDGDNLGWTPKTVHAFSRPFTSPDGPYAMAPIKGAAVNPGNPFGLASGTTTDANTAATLPGATLAYAFAGSGLGLAQLDADLHLRIPVFDAAGSYQAVLTLTAI